MNFKISKNMSIFEDTAVSEVLLLANDPTVISFGGGNPAGDAFPVEAIGNITQEILAENPSLVLQYGVSKGYPPLRETLKTFLKEQHGIGRDTDELLIVSGSQQGADLVSKCLLDAGDTVICEELSFMGYLDTFRSYGANLVGIPMAQDGMDMEKLEEALQANPNTKFIYTIPTFQNPSGITLSLEKRKKMYALAQQYDVVIVEDNPYGEIRFKGEHIPTIKSLDQDGRVIYCGSFSKVMAPAFRVGFLCVDKSLVKMLTIAKEAADVHTNTLFQYIANQYMTQYDFAGHVKEISQLYGRKCQLMLSEMEKHFHPDVTFTRPEGGMFILASFPSGIDAAPFARMAIEHKIAIIPGSVFSAKKGEISNSFRLNFSHPTEEKIVKGIAILGKLTHEYLS